MNMVKNLRIKYESLVQKSQATGGEVETKGEHSQAYYVIKASQEREELQRKGDDLNAKILKSEKELKALDNTHQHLKNRNSNYRDSFLNKVKALCRAGDKTTSTTSPRSRSSARSKAKTSSKNNRNSPIFKRSSTRI